MVAYSFNKRFCQAIVDGTKRQTIRGERKRHARAGEKIQLYTGMRTKGCQKIVPDVMCVSVEPILLRWFPTLMWDVTIGHEKFSLDGGDLRKFCQADGFMDREDMARFWSKFHATPAHDQLAEFSGVLIKWEPV